jgi:L-2-aminoadipate reductase
VDLVVAYMGALKAGATVSVLDPQYPPDRQTIYLEVANPKFLVQIERATELAGRLSDKVRDFITKNLTLKAEVPALKLGDDGTLAGGMVQGKDCLEAQVPLRSQLPDVVVGPDSIPTLSFTSGSEGRPKGVQGRHFSLTYYFPWMAERFNLSENDRFTMLSGIAHDPIQVRPPNRLMIGKTNGCSAIFSHPSSSVHSCSFPVAMTSPMSCSPSG